MKEEKKSSEPGKAILVLFLGVLVGAWLLGAILYGRFAYTEYILTRPEEFTTFQPFSGKLFDLDPSEIRYIRVTNREAAPGVPQQDFYDSQEEIETLAGYLNSFRYSFWTPSLSSSRSYCCVSVMTDDHDYINCQFEQNRFLVNKVWYYGDSSYFQRLMELEK